MSIIQKPEPLVIGNKAFYTLTSYDPVEVQVIEPLTTDDEVELALSAIAEQAGGTREDLEDPSWVEKHLGESSTIDELKDQVRKELDAMNETTVQNQITEQCLEKLSERLCQSVPQNQVEQYENLIARELMASLTGGQAGVTLNDALRSMSISSAQFEALVKEQAKVEAEHAAALDAYASEKKIKVDETELPHLMGLSPADAEAILKKAKAAGQMDALLDSAKRNKALNVVISEAHVTRSKETEEEAKQRLQTTIAQLQAQANAAATASEARNASGTQPSAGGGASPADREDKPAEGGSGLKFV
ncbi:MAG: hypothetical protein ACOYJL_09180 [Tractidigestivibacter sp.]|jgi:hypothetical protein|uniref:hypothetical protein n=1 Tax=Tractidigestivibacter sp. TaxID=2847320 RepID=UPI003D8A75D1